MYNRYGDIRKTDDRPNPDAVQKKATAIEIELIKRKYGVPRASTIHRRLRLRGWKGGRVVAFEKGKIHPRTNILTRYEKKEMEMSA